jgi:hypothetical protein
MSKDESKKDEAKKDDKKEAKAASLASGVYPSWRYHKSQEPRLVQNAEEDAKLGKEWADSPAAFEEKK